MGFPISEQATVEKILDALSGGAAVSSLQGVVPVTAAGTPVPLSATPEYVEAVEIHARKNATTANTGAVYVGFSPSAGQNYRVLLAGDSLTLSAPLGKKLDLSLIYIDAATSGDAVAYTGLN